MTTRCYPRVLAPALLSPALVVPGLFAPVARAQVAVTDDRAAFVAGVDVAYTQDFESFFAPGAVSAGANFGPFSGGFFLPLVYRATNGGAAQLFGTEFHNGDTVAACISGDDAEGLLELGGLYRAAGLDLVRSDRLGPSADAFLVTLMREGEPVAPPLTVPADTFAGFSSDQPFDTIKVAATTDGGTDALEFFDNLVVGDAAGGPCAPADLAEPFGLLDLADIAVFVAAFPGMDPAADLAEPAGLFDLADINAFIASFTAGCP